jgi:hypothetical protein
MGNFVKTSNSSLCQFVAQGVNLQDLTDYNSTFTLPILTSARIIGNKILIQGNKRSTLVDSNLLATLLHAIEVENHVNLEKSSALVFIQIDGRKILTNFDKERENLCLVEKDILGIQKTAIGILSQLNSIFNDAMSLNKLFHDPVDMERFESCVGAKSEFLDLLGVKLNRLEHCLASSFVTLNRTKRSSMLGWLFSDGAELDAVQNSLHDTVQNYNKNFEKIKTLDDQIVIKYNRMTEKLKSMSEHEVLLRDLLITEQVENQMALSRQKFINIKNQHLTAILNLIEHSTVHEDIDLLTRSIFNRNICTIKICEAGIFSTKEKNAFQIGTLITVHREILELEPNADFLIQCQAISATHISDFHNVIGQQITPGTLIINNEIIAEKSLENKTFVNQNLRQIKHEEIHLSNFIVFGHKIQCLTEGEMNLNGIQTSCRSLQVFELQNNFEITAGGKKMTSYHIKSSKSQRLDWGEDYEFSNIPITYLQQIDDDESILGPILDELLLTPAGEIDVAKVAAISGSTVVLILICIVGACLKFEKLRNCCKSCIVKSIPTKAHTNYLKKKLRRKKKILAKNMSMLETAQSLESKAQEMEIRKTKSDLIDETSRGARRKSRSRSKNPKDCPLGYRKCTCQGVEENCRGFIA